MKQPGREDIPENQMSRIFRELDRAVLRGSGDAAALQDLAALPSNRLEALSGDRTGQYSIRINRRWRICFRWEDDGPYDVEVVDYRRGLPLKRSLDMGVSNGMRPVHPGEILGEELEELGLSANALAKALDVPTNRVTAVLNGQRGVTADTALRLSRYFGTTPQLWQNLQKAFELRVAEIESGAHIEERVQPRETAQVRDG